MSKPIIIGLTGKRQVGKSHLADHLVERHGFRRIHPFEGGKAATEAYFVHIGADEDTAHRMVFGDLKDKPSALLPGGVAPRFFMEEFGKFMGSVLGPDWTIGREILRETALAEAEGLTSPRFIVESVVYEVETLRRAGGVVIKVDRPTSGIDGHKSDAFVATIVPDHLIMNTWETLAPLYAEGDRIVEGILANHRAMESLLEDEREPAPC